MINEKQFDKLRNGEVPDESRVFVEGSAAEYIPIGSLESMLDVLQWGTSNFQHTIYKDGYANLCVAASLELKIFYEEASQQQVTRTFVGACNFALAELEPNKHFLATAKSECIKNAASDIGKFFGRGLNDGIVPSQKKTEKPVVKAKPDAKIMQQFLKAVEDGDQATITMLTNIYNIQTPEA